VCDSNGLSQAGGSQDCAPFGCAAGACKTSCTVDGECAMGATCAAGLCSFDAGGDGVLTVKDNCPVDANPLQTDTDNDGIGDRCDSDDDNDGFLDVMDNCPLFANVDQKNKNNDGIGDACDCANPLKPDGAGCDDGDACSQTDTCQSGTCVGSNVVACPLLGACEVGLCSPANGVCLAAQKLDGTPCTGGVCLAGGCFIEGGTSSSSANGSGTGAGSKQQRDRERRHGGYEHERNHEQR